MTIKPFSSRLIEKYSNVVSTYLTPILDLYGMCSIISHRGLWRSRLNSNGKIVCTSAVTCAKFVVCVMAWPAIITMCCFEMFEANIEWNSGRHLIMQQKHFKQTCPWRLETSQLRSTLHALPHAAHSAYFGVFFGNQENTQQQQPAVWFDCNE